ncbi:SulP family inorganic anion transporter [Streptomyces sp. NPDC088789]|uniref:SulP family inorganic anion transporter n=1 Tax=Streptomyces sp. NPDC088789 TaxID=3365899 RepID=UPI0037FC4604
MSASFGTDFVASIVVFLVALPLCIGVAAASGVPVALGIISGIIGGLVVGFLPGSSLQVSGPAAGLAVLVLEFVTEHGVGMLGPVVLVSGLLQMALGALRAGRFFQSISLAVVQGMLAGIGVPLILSQTYAMVDTKQLGTALKNIGGLPDLATTVAGDSTKLAALSLGVMALVLCFVWKKVPAPLSKVPAPLIAVVLGCLIGLLPGFDVKKVSFGNMLDAVNFVTPSSMSHLLDPALLTMIVTFTVIASAESLFSAAAVDRMHTGPRTKYNAELFSQGVGNTIAGLVGALPLTAVIVRSAANVQAGAKTKISRILHGVWLLGFGLLLPGLLGLIPVSVLAGVLLHAGWKLFNPPAFKAMWKTDRGEGTVMFITTGAIVLANLLEGVLAGLAVAIVLVAMRMSRISIRTTTTGDTARVELKGNATFLRLPKLIEALESISDKPRVHVDANGISHLDLACRSQIEEWAEQRRKAGALHVDVRLPSSAEPAEDDLSAVEAEQERVKQGRAERERADSVRDPVGDTVETEVVATVVAAERPPMESVRPPYPAGAASQSMGQGYGHTQSAHDHPTHSHPGHNHPGHSHPAHTHPGHAHPGHGQAGHPHTSHGYAGPSTSYPRQHPSGHPQHQTHPGQLHQGQGHQHPEQPHQPGHDGPPYPQQDPNGLYPRYVEYGQSGEGAGYWGPEDEWAAQQYGEGTRR